MKSASRISAIAAISAQKRALGFKNELLWRIPGDLKHLRELTMGHPIVMGRKTMEHIGSKPLPGRTNIVLTRDPALKVEGFLMAGSIEDALSQAEQSAGSDEIFIFGGAQIYTAALPYTRRLYLTIVHDEPPADAFFPDYSEFPQVVEKSPPMYYNNIEYQYVTLEKP